LMKSAVGGHTERVSALLAAGANVDTRLPDGTTALSLAKKKRHSDVVALLEKAGAKE